MSAPRLSLFALVLICAAACGDPASKLNSADNSQNGSANGSESSELLQYCAANAGEYDCTRDASGFSIAMRLEEGCGDLGTYADECGVTTQLVDACRQKIVECPQGGTVEEHFGEVCGDWFICVAAQSESQNSMPDNVDE